MAELNKLVLPVKNTSTGEITNQEFDLPSGGGGGTIDTELSPTSTNAVQNRVIYNSYPDKGFGNTWSAKTWSGYTSAIGICIWTDGENIYYSNDTDQYVLNKATSTWESKTWNGLTSFSGENIWTDGDNIYYSDIMSGGDKQYVLDKSTSTWSAKIWNLSYTIQGSYVWSDGENIYYSGDGQYILNKSTSTWTAKTWSGYTGVEGIFIWTDGDNFYYSFGTSHYVLDKSTSTWSQKTWTGLTNFEGAYVWTDGTDTYYSDGSKQFVLDKATSTWESKSWNELTSFDGYNIWTDGNNIYYSDGTNNYSISKSKGFGTAAAKDFTTEVTSGSKDLITSGAVYNAIPDTSTFMTKANPTGTGSFSLNRKSETTVGDYSFAEGYNTTASEDYAHAEGFNTTAGGGASHAEGGYSTTSSNFSHAEGYATTAGYDYQHVGGKYNFNKSTTLFEIGNGTSTSERSNAFEVYSDGTLSTDNGTTKTKLPVVKTNTITNGSVTFTNLPSSGNNMIDFYTSVPGANYTAISTSGTSVTLTYGSEYDGATAYCSITEVV